MPPLDVESSPASHGSNLDKGTSIRFALTSLNDPADRRVATLHENSAISIGRSSKSSPSNDGPARISFQNPVVSRRHMCLKIILVDGQKTVGVVDEESLHGTYLGDHRLQPQKPYALMSGDVVRLGNVVNKGFDAHEGIALVFERLETISESASPLSSSYRGGFHVPSESEYSEDSEQERNEDDEDVPSSAKTTPEQTKANKDQVQMEIVDLLDESDDEVFYVDKSVFVAESNKAPVLSGGVEPVYIVQDSFDPVSLVEKRPISKTFATFSDCEEDAQFSAIEVLEDDSDFIEDVDLNEEIAGGPEIESVLPASFGSYEDDIYNNPNDHMSATSVSAHDDRPEVLSSKNPTLLGMYNAPVGFPHAVVDSERSLWQAVPETLLATGSPVDDRTRDAVFDNVARDQRSPAPASARDHGAELLSPEPSTIFDTIKAVRSVLESGFAVDKADTEISLENVVSLEDRPRKSRWDVLPPVDVFAGELKPVDESIPASDPGSLANSIDCGYRPPHIKALLCTPNNNLETSTPVTFDIIEPIAPSSTAARKRKLDEMDDSRISISTNQAIPDTIADQQTVSKKVKLTHSRSRLPWVSFLGGTAIGVASTFTFLGSTYCERLLEWHASL